MVSREAFIRPARGQARTSRILPGSRRDANEELHDDCGGVPATRYDAANQYRLAIGSSSAGNSVITRQPLSVTTTSSSMRAAEKPSVAGQ
jgi:hypothetical protein